MVGLHEEFVEAVSNSTCRWLKAPQVSASWQEMVSSYESLKDYITAWLLAPTRKRLFTIICWCVYVYICREEAGHRGERCRAGRKFHQSTPTLWHTIVSDNAVHVSMWEYVRAYVCVCESVCVCVGGEWIHQQYSSTFEKQVQIPFNSIRKLFFRHNLDSLKMVHTLNTKNLFGEN